MGHGSLLLGHNHPEVTKAVAEQVYLATDTGKVMAEMGLTPPTQRRPCRGLCCGQFRETSPDQFLGLTHDSADQLFAGRDVVDEARHKAA